MFCSNEIVYNNNNDNHRQSSKNLTRKSDVQKIVRVQRIKLQKRGSQKCYPYLLKIFRSVLSTIYVRKRAENEMNKKHQAVCINTKNMNTEKVKIEYKGKVAIASKITTVSFSESNLLRCPKPRRNPFWRAII